MPSQTHAAPSANESLEDQLQVSRGFVSATACHYAMGRAANFDDASNLHQAVTGAQAAAMIALTQQEAAIREKVKQYLYVTALTGSAEEKKSLETALHIPDAADRLIVTYLHSRILAGYALTPGEREQDKRLTNVKPVDYDTMFGALAHEKGPHHLEDVVRALDAEPQLHHHAALDNIRRLIARTHEFNQIRKDMDALVEALGTLADIDFSNAHERRREDGKSVITFTKNLPEGPKEYDIDVALITHKHATDTIERFFKTYDRQIHFNEWDKKKNYHFLDSEYNNAQAIRTGLLNMINGRVDLAPEHQQPYGQDFPSLHSLAQINAAEGVAGTRYPNPALHTPYLIDQLEGALNVLTHTREDDRLKPLRDVIKVVRAVEKHDGTYGDYLGTQATAAAIAARNERLGINAGDDGYIESTDHPDAILFNDALIRLDYRAIAEAVAAARAVAADYPDKRLREDFDSVITRFQYRMLDPQERFATHFAADEVETGPDTAASVYSVSKKDSAQRTMYEIGVDNTLLSKMVDSSNPAYLKSQSKALLEHLKQVIAESPYCGSVHPAIIDNKLRLYDVPPYISEFLEAQIIPAQSIEAEMETLVANAAEKGKKFTLGKVTNHPENGTCSFTLIAPETIHPSQKATYYQPLMEAITTQFTPETCPDMTLKVERQRDLTIRNAPAAVVTALQTGLGLNAESRGV